MELKELKCKNCGAKIELEEGKTEATCKYCNTTFKVDDEYSKAYNYTKGVLKAQNEQMHERLNEYNNSMVGKATKWISAVIFLMAFLIIVAIIGTLIYDSTSLKSKNNRENIVDKSENNDDNDFDAQWFNTNFSGFNGTKSTSFIKGYLDRIATNNKTEKEHIITVKYLDKETSDPDEIVAIKESLAENGEYELSMDYDEKGFFNKLTIVE